MTKSDLADIVSLRTGLSSQPVRLVLDTLFERIAQELTSGKEVKIHGFGTFLLAPCTHGKRVKFWPSEKIRGKLKEVTP